MRSIALAMAGLLTFGWAACQETAAPAVKEPVPGLLKKGDWVRYGREGESGQPVRTDTGLLIYVKEVEGDRLTLAFHAKAAATPVEAEKQLRATGRRLFPELTTAQIAAFAEKAVRDPKGMTEKDMAGLPPDWVKELLMPLKETDGEVGEPQKAAMIKRMAQRMAAVLPDRRADTVFHLQWLMTEHESAAVLDPAAPLPVALLPVGDQVEPHADIEEKVEQRKEGDPVPVDGRELRCRKRVYDAKVNRQGMKTLYHAESWLSEEIPWRVVRCRLSIEDLPDESLTTERYGLSLLEYGDAATLPKAPFFPPSPEVRPAP